MGTVPGGGLLSASLPHASSGSDPPCAVPEALRWLEVDPWRSRTGRTMAFRHPDARTVILGTTQPEGTVDRVAAERWSAAIARRRSGGGAVLVEQGDPVWVDVWVPRSDPLWRQDVVEAAYWIGEWWARALTGLGVPDAAVHRGPSLSAPWSHLVCFAGVGPGEVSVRRRKLVGLSQWRSRQGALFQICAYRRWDPGPLVELLALEEGQRRRVLAEVTGCAVGLEELAVPASDLRAALAEALPAGPPWGVLST